MFAVESKNSFFLVFIFSDFRPTSFERGHEIARLRIYKVYAWGLPLIIASTAIYLDNVPKQPGDLVLRPKFGQPKCWFEEGKISYFDFTMKRLTRTNITFYQFLSFSHLLADGLEILVYFYGPVGILLFINLMLFLSTARQLTCGLWKREEVKSTTER